MLPYIYVLGRPIPMYGICALTGIIVAAIVVAFTLRGRKDYSKLHIVNIPIFAAIGAFLGAHLVYFITRLDFFVKAMQNPDITFSSWNSFWAVLGEVFGGMVFYGGLLGAIFAAFIYCRVAKADFSLYADIIAPAIPLFHAFGRVGCVFAGCCYGIESSWGLTYTHTENGIEHTVTRLPLPLIEAGCNLVIMAVLFILSKKHLKKGSLLGIYFVLYSIVRFTDEFFRGDEIRGALLGLSTSQWISIFVLAVGIYMLLNRYVLKNKDSFGYHVPKGQIPPGYVYNKNAGAIAPWEMDKLGKDAVVERPEGEPAPEAPAEGEGTAPTDGEATAPADTEEPLPQDSGTDTE